MKEWQKRLTFVLYVIGSAILAFIKITTLYDEAPNFYVLGAKLAEGDALLIVSNMLIAFVLLIGKIFQTLIFGELRLIEIEHLYERLWPTIIGVLFSTASYNNNGNTFTKVLLIVSLLFGKIFHSIMIDRLDFLIQRYYQNVDNNNNNKYLFLKLFKNRVIFSLFFFLKFDIKIIKACIDESFINKSAILLVVAFEFFLLISDLAYSTVKFLLNVNEIFYIKRYPDEEIWPYKVWIDSITKVLICSIRCIMIPVLFTLFTLIDIIPLNLINEIFRSGFDLSRSIASLYRLIKNVKKLNNSLSYPTKEELENTDICIICRDDMVLNGTGTPRSVPKKLPCGHILHDGCIRSWLERSNACPTCRKEVIPSNGNKDENSNNNNPIVVNNNDNNNIDNLRENNLIEPINDIQRNIDDDNNNHDNDNDNNNDSDNDNDNDNHDHNENSSIEETEYFDNDDTERENERDNLNIDQLRISRLNRFIGLNHNNNNNSNAELNDDHFEVEDYDSAKAIIEDTNLIGRIREIVSRVNNFELSPEQRNSFNRINQDIYDIESELKLKHNNNSNMSGENIEDDEFSLNLPSDSTIPKDWTIFPLEKMDENEYQIKLGSKKRVNMKIVKNSRIISKDTFEKYVIRN